MLPKGPLVAEERAKWGSRGRGGLAMVRLALRKGLQQYNLLLEFAEELMIVCLSEQ